MRFKWSGKVLQQLDDSYGPKEHLTVDYTGPYSFISNMFYNSLIKKSLETFKFIESWMFDID